MTEWEALRQECLHCHACTLAETRTNVVFGVGREDAEIMIIGEAPGANEDKQGEPFVGRGGKLLVSAAAGSGKTKVLVDRLLGFLTQTYDPANLDEFLIITYTKAAASELRGKIAKKLTEEIAQRPEETHLQRQMQRLFLTKISTVHGFCSDLLREYAYKLDIAADFRVADENECREIRENGGG